MTNKIKTEFTGQLKVLIEMAVNGCSEDIDLIKPCIVWQEGAITSVAILFQNIKTLAMINHCYRI